MSGFEQVFAELRAVMLSAAGGQHVVKDEPGDLIVHTHEVDPKTGKPIWFGAVTSKKSYVAYHLFPLYADPGLGTGIPDALRARQQGKSCFNFKTHDPALFEALRDLTLRCRPDAAEDGTLQRPGEPSARAQIATPVNTGSA